MNGAWKQVGTTSSLSYKVNGITQNGVNKFRVKARRNYSGVYYNGGYTYVNAEVTDGESNLHRRFLLVSRLRLSLQTLLHQTP